METDRNEVERCDSASRYSDWKLDFKQAAGMQQPGEEDRQTDTTGKKNLLNTHCIFIHCWFELEKGEGREVP
jgi:hypothetical protein